MNSRFVLIFLACFLSVAVSLSASAFSVGIGSPIEVNSKPGVFLGNLLNHDGTTNSLMILDPSAATVRYIAPSKFRNLPDGMQNVLKLYEQKGGTCTGYAIDDFLLQTHFSGFVGNGQLAQDVSTEEGRTGLLADAINEYYMVLQHRFSILGILNKYGKAYQFSCAKKVFKDRDSAIDFLKESLKSGFPVLISFDLGPNMTDGPFKLMNENSATSEDVRLWLPRKIGERNSGGHSVVAVGGFSMGKSDYLVMLDSDWNLPRIWDLKDALTERTDFAGTEFYTCH